MKESVKNIFEELFLRYPELEVCRDSILEAYNIIRATYENGGCLFACGNGGSCSDSEHIIGELLKSFKFKRKINPILAEKLSEMGEYGKDLANTLEGALPAVSLCGHGALTTAFLNDTEPTMTFAQQLLGLGNAGDTLIVISTSGNSKNCTYAATLAKAMGIKTVAMTGEKESKLSALCDVTIKAPECETFKIQEKHLPIYHALCAMAEETFFENTGHK
jgi:D-sedoheptulose 7-phosphate isomerase